MLEHPDDKEEDLIRNGGRLLGELAPTRAFGDVRYKWTMERLQQMTDYFGADADSAEKMTASSWAGLEAFPTPYTSPPYLTAKPEVTTCMVGGPFIKSFMWHLGYPRKYTNLKVGLLPKWKGIIQLVAWVAW